MGGVMCTVWLMTRGNNKSLVAGYQGGYEDHGTGKMSGSKGTTCAPRAGRTSCSARHHCDRASPNSYNAFRRRRNFPNKFIPDGGRTNTSLVQFTTLNECRANIQRHRRRALGRHHSQGYTQGRLRTDRRKRLHVLYAALFKATNHQASFRLKRAII